MLNGREKPWEVLAMATPSGEMEQNDVCRKIANAENGQHEDILVGLEEGPKG